MEDLDLATVATFAVRHEAEIAKALLASVGIGSVVQADDEGGLNPGFFAEYGVRLVVRREQLEKASEALADPGSESRGALAVHSEHLEAFAAHASFCAPEEACGLLAFDTEGRLRFVYCLTNIDHSPHRFTVDPTEHFRALQHAERNGWEIGGSFHSHPGGGAEPSGTDVAAALDPSWIHVIVGSGSGGTQIKAYRVRSGSVVDVPVAGH